MMTYLRVIYAAIRRHHLEKPIRDQFTGSRRQRKMPFKIMVRKLAADGEITPEEKKHIINKYSFYSSILHGSYHRCPKT